MSVILQKNGMSLCDFRDHKDLGGGGPGERGEQLYLYIETCRRKRCPLLSVSSNRIRRSSVTTMIPRKTRTRSKYFYVESAGKKRTRRQTQEKVLEGSAAVKKV